MQSTTFRSKLVQQAHELGIVHRDIKPANLLLDDHARLYITDFGLASMEANAGATATGDVIGTVRYIPPEQALGKSELIDHRADIYSLGVTLYELLSLKSAFEGRNRQELLQHVTSKEPERLRRRQPALPAELETIVMKAIAKDRDERYAAAGDFADDLARFVANQPIHARRVSQLHRARKWTQRNAVLVSTALALLLLAATMSS
jgi:serine/threonine protein kinase